MNQVLVSASDCIAVLLAEQAGFDGIWVSSFECSSKLGIPDDGRITLDDMLLFVEAVVRSTRLPVWVDVDTGYDDILETAKTMENVGAYGICLQDNAINQKKNSLWGGDAPLMDAEKFADKIHTASQVELKIMARTEAVIRGHGIDEARRRIELYQDAGADFLLPNIREEKDIIDAPAGRSWAIIPTRFPHLADKYLFLKGYSIVIRAMTEAIRTHHTKEYFSFLRRQGSYPNIDAYLDEIKNLFNRE